MWKKGITNPGRVVDDYVSFIDLAPTFLGVANLDWKKSGMAPTPGLSLQDLFASAKSGSGLAFCKTPSGEAMVKDISPPS